MTMLNKNTKVYKGKTYIDYGDDGEKLITCDTVGMYGDCGLDCPIYLDGECQNHLDAIYKLKTEEDKETYIEVYGDYLYNYAMGEE